MFQSSHFHQLITHQNESFGARWRWWRKSQRSEIGYCWDILNIWFNNWEVDFAFVVLIVEILMCFFFFFNHDSFFLTTMFDHWLKLLYQLQTTETHIISL